MAGYIGKITAGGTTRPIAHTLYGTCSTAAATAAKVVTCSDFDTLITGVMIAVKFTYSNTASTPTLNVNSTGAKSIYRYGTTAPGSTTATSWYAGSVICFVYDGSYWQMIDWMDTDTTPTLNLSNATGTLAVGNGGTGQTSSSPNVFGKNQATVTTLGFTNNNSNFTLNGYVCYAGQSGSTYRGMVFFFINMYKSGGITVGNVSSQTKIATLSNSNYAPKTMIFASLCTNQAVDKEVCVKVTTAGEIDVYSNDETSYTYDMIRGSIAWRY